MNPQHDDQPRLLSGIRRFGRYEKFQDINNPSGHASVGGKSVGKISIDCQFAFRQSQWGVLGEDQCPVGVLYMNLNFSPPQGCRLKNATVTVTLDDEDPCLTSYKLARTQPTHVSNTPVQITDWYGPKQLAGRERTIDKTRFKQFIPEASFMGNGGGGVGGGSETSFQQSARWLFSGQLLPGKKTRIYKTLRWDLVENELEKQPSRSNRVYTAFSFVHSGQPFLMKVDVDGRLEKWDKQVMSKLSFGNVKKKVRDNDAVTLIDFAEYSKFQRRLDDIVHGLPRAMEMKNVLETLPVVPEPVEISFGAASPSGSQTLQQPQIPATIRVEEFLPGNVRPAEIANSVDQHLLQGPPTPQLRPWSESTGTAPSIEDLAQMMRSLSTLLDHRNQLEDTPLTSAEETVVGSTNDEGLEEPTQGPKEDITATAQVPTTPVATVVQIEAINHPDPESVVRILQIPALVGVLRMLIALMSLLGYLPANQKTDREDQGVKIEEGHEGGRQVPKGEEACSKTTSNDGKG